MPLAILNILVAFHGVRFTGTSLSIGENSRMIAVANLTNHGFNTYLLIERTLVCGAITHLIKLIALLLLVPCIEPQLYIVVRCV